MPRGKQRGWEWDEVERKGKREEDERKSMVVPKIVNKLRRMK